MYHLFLAEGDTLVKDLMPSKIKFDAIYGLRVWIDTNRGFLDKYEINYNEVSEKQLGQLSSLTTPNQVVGVVKIPDHDHDPKQLNGTISLALDTIRDPGNLGTIIRIADWFGIPYIFCSPRCVDAYNPKVVKASMGSIARVKLFYRDLAELFSTHSQMTVYGATLKGKSIYELPSVKKGIILIGQEASGIDPQLMPYVSQEINIPRHGKAESLNAAIAAAIICAQFIK